LGQKVDLVIGGYATRSDLDDMVRWVAILAKTCRVGSRPPPDLDDAREVSRVFAERLHEGQDALLPSFDVDAALAS